MHLSMQSPTTLVSWTSGKLHISYLCSVEVAVCIDKWLVVGGRNQKLILASIGQTLIQGLGPRDYHYPPPGTREGFVGALLVKSSPGGGNFVKSVYRY